MNNFPNPERDLYYLYRNIISMYYQISIINATCYRLDITYVNLRIYMNNNHEEERRENIAPSSLINQASKGPNIIKNSSRHAVVKTNTA